MVAQPRGGVIHWGGPACAIQHVHDRTELHAAGPVGDTLAALIYRATWPNQKIHPCTLATLTQTARRHKVRPPALVVIGSVLSLIPKSEGCPAVSWEQLTAFADLHKAPDCP